MVNGNLTDRSFSVLICVYGKDDPDLFNEAVDSIFLQTLLPLELVIVVDGPVPDSLRRAISYVHRKASEFLISTEVLWEVMNSGHGVARNKGINACSYNIVVLCDADDINLSHRFATLVPEMISDPSLSVVGSNVVEIAKGNRSALGLRCVKETHNAIITDMSIRCPFNQMTVALRRSHVLFVGGYRSIYNNEDYDLWIRLASADGVFRNVSEPLVHATVDQDFFSRRGGLKYFLAEFYIQKCLLRCGFATPLQFALNCVKRFAVQLLLPPPIRKYVFQKFARSSFPNEK